MKSLKKIITSSILSIALCSNSSFAQDAANQISSMIQTGQFENALNTIDNELKAKPKDPLLKFQRGIALSGLGRNDDAIVEFSKITEEYPQLPEPYNNLAVLYSSKGDLAKAKTSLELAIKAQPNYATAYDNLGDIHSKLANQYYQQAITIDSNNVSAKSKIDLLAPITTIAIGSRQVYNSRAASAAFPSAPPVIVQDEKYSKSRNKMANEIKEPKEVKVTKKPVVKEKSPKDDKKLETPVIDNAPKTAEQTEIIKNVNDWANAWSSKNVNGYLSHYASDFKPENGDKAKWEENRKLRIQDKGNISVSVSNPVVNIKGDTATVNFRQTYKSDKFQDVTQKTLNMTKVNGKWQIKQEKGN